MIATEFCKFYDNTVVWAHTYFWRFTTDDNEACYELPVRRQFVKWVLSPVDPIAAQPNYQGRSSLPHNNNQTANGFDDEMKCKQGVNSVQ